MTLPVGSDELLVAWLDNELDPTQRRELETRLAEDAELAQRLALFEQSSLPFKAAFEPLLNVAPVGRLLPPAAPVFSLSRRHLIAAAVGFLALGVAGDRLLIRATREEESWRDLVARYMALYTPETLAETPSRASLETQVKMTGQQLGLPLSIDALTLPPAILKNARLLAYDEQYIAQITWLYPQAGPLALCITRNRERRIAAGSERRLGMNIVYWASASHQFMVIGHNPEAQMRDLAAVLQRHMSG
ncbi:anti-sigma factor family protein [[Enterobacter] lignolyticus]|uniref:Transmembrane anti-sigma factor n=1 Tax=Enterobacter lignolyticus (strain SCF1) TaxID=701347 RepID=E3GD35_ENTLS|nr:anti-sigma factor [[Enterobacter] lignolyticus]ADO49054.1 putative transmembrane anti-sigma factor [[Enterobacter] lignolyticus SCF1]